MRVQLMTAVILGLTLSPAAVLGRTCAAPPERKTASVSGTAPNSDNPQLPAAIQVMLMYASQPLLAYTANAGSGSFVFNQVLPPESVTRSFQLE